MWVKRDEVRGDKFTEWLVGILIKFLPFFVSSRCFVGLIYFDALALSSKL